MDLQFSGVVHVLFYMNPEIVHVVPVFNEFFYDSFCQ